MTREEIALAIASRPEPDLADAIAAAAYTAHLEAQESGAPGSALVSILSDFAEVARSLTADVERLAASAP